MRVWKLIGLAGVAGVAAGTAVVVTRRRRQWTEPTADELRARLHQRLADASSEVAGETA